MLEKNFQTLFGSWLRKNNPKGNYTYELKLIKKGNFRFKQVQEEQVRSLVESLGGFYHKIPDMTAQNGFSGRKPFDCLWMHADQAYVVPCFYSPRKYKDAYLIPVSLFCELRQRSVSLSKKQADDLVSEGLVEKVSL